MFECQNNTVNDQIPGFVFPNGKFLCYDTIWKDTLEQTFKKIIT